MVYGVAYSEDEIFSAFPCQSGECCRFGVVQGGKKRRSSSGSREWDKAEKKGMTERGKAGTGYDGKAKSGRAGTDDRRDSREVV